MRERGEKGGTKGNNSIVTFYRDRKRSFVYCMSLKKKGKKAGIKSR